MKSQKGRPPALTPPLAWAETSRHPWPLGSPSPLDHTSPVRAAQRLARVGICPLSIRLFSRPLSRAFIAGPSIGCIDGRDVPVSGSGPPPSLCHRTTSISCRLGGPTISGTCPLAHTRTSVGTIWLPVTSHYSLGWVSCSQLCLSACSHDVCCICRPPTQPSPPSLLLRLVWSYSQPSCICLLVLCLHCGLLAARVQVPGVPLARWQPASR